MTAWKAVQFGGIVSRFKAICPPAAWKDLLARYAILRQLGPMCGPAVAKKLVNGKGIWELLGHADNAQPRLLFYFDVPAHRIIFVEAFVKKGSQDYGPAIELAQKRRASIERGDKVPNELSQADTTNVH